MAEYQAWQKSAHAHAAQDTMVKFGAGVEQQARGVQYSRQCAGCHDPVSLRLGDSSLASGRGITCRGCHDVDRLIRAGGNADLETAAYDWTQVHVQRAGAQLAYLKTPDFCAGCHQQFVPGTGIVAINTLGEWQASPFVGPPPEEASASGDSGPSPGIGDSGTGGAFLQAMSPLRSCVDCHMPDDGTGLHDHSAAGGNVYIAQQFAEPDFAATVKRRLSSAIQLQAYYSGDEAHVTVMNVGSGHAFPTGVTDIREPWVELQAIDSAGNVIATYGGPDASGLIPAGAARFGMDIAAPDGTILYRHELTSATRIPFARFVPAQGSVVVRVPVPTQLPAGIRRTGRRPQLPQRSHAILPGGDGRRDRARARCRGGSNRLERPVMRCSSPLLLVVLPLLVTSCGGGGSGTGSARAGLVDPAVLERGEYLVRSVAGCGECHTPRDAQGDIDQSQWLAGVANRFDLVPGDDTMGGISAPNLTPASLASWTDQQIEHAFLDGVGIDGAPLFPLMPYYAFHNMTPGDAEAIVTYLRSVPAIDNAVPPRQPLPVPLVAAAPPVPEDAIPHTTLAASDPNHAAAERGRYLAGEVGFCLDCHTPWRLGVAQPLDLTLVFAGGRGFSAKEWSVPAPAPPVIYSRNVTPSPNGIAGWSAEDVVNVLLQGVSPQGGSLCRPMPDGPLGAFGALSRDDDRDIGLHLTTIPPIDGGDIPSCANP